MARFGDFDQYLDNAGDPLVSGKIYFYESGTTTFKNTYADINNSIPNTNPVILTAAGRQPNVFFDGVAKAILATSADVQIAVIDPVGETSSAFGDQWVATKIYSATDVVLGSDGIFYRSLVNGNQGNNPVNTTGFWTLLYSVEWNAGITYSVGDVVLYGTQQYQSLQNSNLNQNPATKTAYWVGLSFAWLATRTYAIHENVVGTDGILYTSLQNSNLNHVPATSAAWWVGTSAAAATSATAAAASAAAAVVAKDASVVAKNESVTAKNESVTAKDLSVTAKNESVAAKDLSVAAKDAAVVAKNAAATSATAAAASYASFIERYMGAFSTAPSTSFEGALYWNSVSDQMFVWNGSSWEVISGNGTVTSVQMAGGSTGLTYSGGPITGSGTITTAGTLAAANGGTGATTLAANAVIIGSGTSPVTSVAPSTSGNVLKSDGTNWTSAPEQSGGTVTSVGVVGGSTGLTTSGGPITTSGNITLAGTLVVANGGTGATTLTANNVVLGNGASAVQVVAPSTSGNVLTSDGSTWASTAPAGGGNSLDFVAAGTLASGRSVVLKADGTVAAVGESTLPEGAGTPVTFSATQATYPAQAYDSLNNKIILAHSTESDTGVALVGTVSGSTISFGTAVVFEASSAVSNTSATFDSNAGKVVIVYKDNGNSSYGTAIVGTVSGTSISFGTAVVFESANTQYTATTFDSNANKVVIAYSDVGNSSYGKAIVGTVSGTSISFGSAVTFESATTNNIGAVFESNTNKIVIGYRDGGNLNYGTAKVGTVSGTSISFGSAVVFETATAEYVNCVYDPNTTKVVLAYKGSGGGKAIVATLSGTSISFGTAVGFNSDAEYTAPQYDLASQKVIIGFRDGNNSMYATAIVGTVSGTSISFGTAVVLMASGDGNQPNSIYDVNAKRTVVSFWNNGSTSTGRSVVFTSEQTVTNVADFVGITDASISSGATGSVTVLGGISETLSSLSPNVNYYVQDDGTITTTVSTELAGLALSSTKILLKGTS